MRIPLPIIASNCLSELEESLDDFRSDDLSLGSALAFCAFHRKAGIASLFMSGLPDEFFEGLFKSARAFADALGRMPAAEKATGKAEPFFDAVACNDSRGARLIAAASPGSHNPDLEYEEDFLYMRALMEWDAGEAQALPGRLARWEELAEGRMDLRLEIVRALSGRDSEGFNAGLGTLMGELRDEYAEGARRDAYLQEDLQTVLRLSVEGLALARLAERAGLAPDREFPLMPSAARIGGNVVDLPDDAWIP